MQGKHRAKVGYLQYIKVGYLQYPTQNWGETFFLFCEGTPALHKFYLSSLKSRGGSRTAATSKMERFVIIVNGWKPLTIITKCSILDVAAVLGPPLKSLINMQHAT